MYFSRKLAIYDDWSNLEVHIALDNTLVIGDLKRLCGATPKYWKPLLLVLPLRLGLSEINPVYVEGLKMCFSFKQSLGVIGGKPNHALYFIGCVGEELLFLDPHTTQMATRTNEKCHSKEQTADSTYHCQFASRSPILDLDPSVAVCFFCRTERDIDSLCHLLQQSLIADQKQPLFEICSERPAQWSSTMEDSLICLEGASVSYAVEAANVGKNFTSTLKEPLTCNFIQETYWGIC
ncbi:hypothetical protein B566_EDAN003113 [Ephemera danica]|nr:hypothetical protein B566_EDAN003113 [Ephemera danica]